MPDPWAWEPVASSRAMGNRYLAFKGLPKACACCCRDYWYSFFTETTGTALHVLRSREKVGDQGAPWIKFRAVRYLQTLALSVYTI